MKDARVAERIHRDSSPAWRPLDPLFSLLIFVVLLGSSACLQAQNDKASGAGSHTATNATGTTIAQQVAVPAYFAPPSFWPQLISPVGMAIANVSNGPNNSVDATYTSAIQSAQQAGVKVLGYVDTGYFGGSSPARLTRLGQSDANSWTAQIEQDVDTWYNLYGTNGLGGIFFDDGQNVCGTNNQYVTLYTDIMNYVKGNHPGAYVVVNPGVSVPQCLENVADTLLTFEGSYACYTNDPSCPAGEAFTPPTWTSTDPQKIFHIVYAVPEASLANAVALTKQNNAGFVYLTTAQLADNPYATLPDFFAQEVIDSAAGGAPDPTTPTTPCKMVARTVGDTSVTLNWNASTDANGSGVVVYDIYQNGVKITSVPASGAPQTTLTGLTPATPYSFTATARSVAGKVSAQSTPLSVMTGSCGCAVAAPQAQAAQVNFTDVVLSWTPPQSQLADYDVFLNGTKVVTVDAGVTSADVIGLTPSTAYTLSVQAVDTFGDRSPSSIVSVTTAPFPAGGGITNVKVQHTATAVTITADFLVPWAFHQVYIDADNNSATGYLFGWETPPLGADYLLENDTLSAHTGSDQTAFSWSSVATVEPVVTGSASVGLTYTWTIPNSAFTGVPLGSPASFLAHGDGYADEVYAPIVAVSQQ